MDKVGERKDVRAGGEDLLCAGFVSRAKIVRPGAFSVADPPPRRLKAKQAINQSRGSRLTGFRRQHDFSPPPLISWVRGLCLDSIVSEAIYSLTSCCARRCRPSDPRLAHLFLLLILLLIHFHSPLAAPSTTSPTPALLPQAVMPRRLLPM